MYTHTDNLSNKPHLTIFMDVNGTVTAKDSAIYSEEVSDNAIHPAFLLDVTRSVVAQWDLTKPNCKRYINYLEDDLYPIPPNASKEESTALDKARKDSYLKVFDLASQRINEGIATKWREKCHAAQVRLNSIKSETGDIKVFPSFTKAILELKREEVNFQVVLRTLGFEAYEAMEEVNKQLSKTDESLSKFFDGRVHKLDHTSDGNFVLTRDGGVSEVIQRKELADVISRLGNTAIQDNYFTWNRDNNLGKAYPIDPDRCSLFWDDWHGANNVIHPFHAHTGELWNDPSRMPPTSTLEMLTNDDAIIDTIREHLRIMQAKA